MRRIAAFFIATVALTAYPSGQPATHPVSLADLLSIRQVSAPQLSPDASAILYAVRGWENGTGKDAERKDSRSHIWKVRADGSAPARQLTFSDPGESAPAWSPDGRTISFLSARQQDGGAVAPGAEPIVQIWLMRADGGEAAVLTTSKESISGYTWSPDSTKIAFVARDPLSKAIDDKHKRRDDAAVFEDDFRLSHLWLVDVPPSGSSGAPARELTHDPHLTIQGTPTWSADSARIAFAAGSTTMVRDDRTDIFIVSSKGGEAEKVTTNLGPDRDPVWSPDGATIAYTSAPNAAAALPDGTQPSYVGNGHLMLYDVAARRTKDAANRGFDLSPGALHWSADSRALLFSTGVKTARDLFAYDTTTNAYTRLTHGRITNLGSVAHDRAAFVMESSSEPGEIYVASPLRLKSDIGDLSMKKLTDTNSHARSFALGTSEVVSWKSDGLTIEGVLLKPLHYDAGRRYPLLVVAHGGPSGAYLDNYRVGYGDGSQNWAGEGWAVLYPNPRGSTNYGESFERANFKDWGGGDYRDIMAGVDAMVAKGIADPDKLAFQGWSYGGYMTCWVVSQTTRFKAAMQGAGLTDMPSMYGTNDIPNVLIPYFGGIPTKDTLPLYEARSGITYVDRVTTPLLILHGGSDQRVPIGQPMEFFRALKDRGKTVELVFYPREGHGFSEYYHQLDRLQRQHEWIARYTLGAGARKSTQP